MNFMFDLQLFGDILNAGTKIDLSGKTVTIGVGASGDITTTVGTDTALSIGFKITGTDYGVTGMSTQDADDENYNTFAVLTGTSIVNSSSVSYFNPTGVAFTSTSDIATKAGYSFILSNVSISSLSLGQTAYNVNLTSVSKVVEVSGYGNSKANVGTLTFGSSSNVTLKHTQQGLLSGSQKIVNSDSTLVLATGTSFGSGSGLEIVGKETGSIGITAYSTSILNLGEGTKGVTMDMKSFKAGGVSLGMEGANLTITNVSGGVQFNSLTKESTVSIVGAKGYDATIDFSFAGSDSVSGVYFTAVSAGNNGTALSLTGRGIEHITLEDGADLNVSRFVDVFKTLGGDSKATTLDINGYSPLSLSGKVENGTVELTVGDTGNKGKLTFANYQVATSVVGTGARTLTADKRMWAGVKVNDGNADYNALVVSNDSLKGSDIDSLIGSVNIIVADKLDLGNVTKKNVVYLNNGLTSAQQYLGDTSAYGTGVSAVVSSSKGGTLIWGDVQDRDVNFYANGDKDTLYAGVANSLTGTASEASDGNLHRDTLGSAASKSAWFLTGEDSGRSVIQMTDSGKETNNFGFVGENSETNETADRIMMQTLSFASIKSGKNGTANFYVGYNDTNYLEFEGITQGNHQLIYDTGSFDVSSGVKNGGEINVLLNTSLKGGEMDYTTGVGMYFGGSGSATLKLSSSNTGVAVNYGAGSTDSVASVILGVSTIDGSAGGANNTLKGETNKQTTVLASTSAATTITGGFDSDYNDSTDDVLVGGKSTTFQVGKGMGNDTLQSVADGSVVNFLGTKFEGVSGFTTSSSKTTLYWNDGATITIDGDLTKNKDLTATFDDYMFTWNGSEWKVQ